MYIKRHIEDAVKRRAKMKGAVVVTGARQTGKTTLMEKINPDILSVTFDHLPTRRRAIEEPSAFFDLYPPPIFIDEVQYAPDIFHYIKIMLDKSKKKGDFYLTGSQNFSLMKNMSESLAGRAGILELMGLSMREIHGESFCSPFIPTLDYLMKRKACKTGLSSEKIWGLIHRGSMPELVADSGYEWAAFYADYVKTYIERDVRNLTQVADEGDFLKFLTVCAAMNGQMLNLSKVAREVGVSEPTAKRWLSILKSSGVVYLLKPFSNNAIKRAVKTPKIYFLDSGLSAYLTRWVTVDVLKNGAMNGAFFESFVVSEIIKSYANSGADVDLYYLRDGMGREIDVLIHENNTLYPLEIKVSAEPSPREIKHFGLLEEISNIIIGEGGIICMSEELLPLTDKHKIIPLWAI